MDFVLVDLASHDKETLDKFLTLVHYPKDKVSSKQRPTVFIKADNRLSKISPSRLLNKSDRFPQTMSKESSMIRVKSVKDLADSIHKYNRSLNDTTIVYCKRENDDDFQSAETQAAVRLMRQESRSPLLVVTEKELAT